MKFISIPGLKKYSQNTVYLVVEKVVRIVIGVTIWATVARYLGPEEFGIFNYALSFVFLFKICADLGLDFIVVREFVKDRFKKFQIMGTAFLIKFSGGIFAMLLVFIAIYFMPVSQHTRYMTLIMSFRLIFQPFNIIDFYFQSRVLSKYVVFSQIIGLVTTSVLCLVFIYYKLPLIYFVCAAVIELAVTSVFFTIFYKRIDKEKIPMQFRADFAKTLMKDAWPLVIAGIAVSVYMRIDQIMIKELLDIASVGYYSAAVRISEAFYFFPVILAKSLFPATVNAKLRSESIYKDRFQALFTFLLWTAIGISLVTTLISKSVVNILYGTEYSPTASVLAIHIWASVFVFLGVARTKWIINENLQFFAMVYAILGAVVNITMNLILIPLFNTKGAAIATVISQCVATVLSNLLSAKTRPLFLLQLAACNPVRIIKELLSKARQYTH